MTAVRPISGRYVRFALALAAIAGIWTIALPWIAEQPAESQRWKAMQQAGIDPSAMYYSELDAMQPILDRLNRGERIDTPDNGLGPRVR